MRPSSRPRGLYRSFLRDEFLVRWFKLVGFKVLVSKIPFLHDQIFDFQNFVEDSYVRFQLQRKSYSTVVYCSVTTLRVV